MYRLKYIAVFIVAGILSAAAMTGRAQLLYHMNIDKGLPTNFVYNLLVDSHGYLWIATKKGIVKYNGYKARVFDFSNGLNKEDVWRQYEDKKGRIWISSIARQIGYIKNDKFNLAVNLSQMVMYPKHIGETDSGVFFINQAAGPMTMFRENKDTFRAYTYPRTVVTWLKRRRNELLLKLGDSLMDVKYRCSEGKVYLTNTRFVMTDTMKPDVPFASIYGRYWIGCAKGMSYLWIKDLEKGKDSMLDFQKETHTNDRILRAFLDDGNYSRESHYLVISDNGLYFIDSTLHFVKRDVFDLLLRNGGGSKVSFYEEDTLWGSMLATYTDGIYLRYPSENMFREIGGLQFSDYRYLGNDAVFNHYWWSDRNKILARVDHNFHIVNKKCESVFEAQSITPYNKDSALLCTRTGLFWLNTHTLATSNYLSGFEKIFSNYPRMLTPSRLIEAFKIIRTPTVTYFQNTNGIAEVTRNKKQNELRFNYFNFERFNTMVYDTFRRNLWLYSDDNVEVYRDNKRLFALSPSVAKNLKIKNVGCILADNHYGNIFVLEYDRLLMFDDNVSQYRTLFSNYLLNGAVMQIAGDVLIVAGKFGILFCKIKGKGKIGYPVVFENIKSMAYGYVMDIQVSDSTVLLKTDSKLYSVAFPPDNILNNAPRPAPRPFKLLFFCNGGYIDIKQGDTVKLSQDDLEIRFDIINPKGSGEPVYQYKIAGIDKDWVKLIANDLLLSDLQPGKYYDLSLMINDDVWRSAPVKACLYIAPYWWQKPGWVLCFWITGISALLLFGLVVAKMTRQIVMRKNERRNAMLELELKAIYSQINPHFIYNTLNSALLLIRNNKMDDAYRHVFKFSRLLRAYVRSSRNKYISLEEEIANIRNYVELQQTRFRDKFTYDVIVNEGIDIVTEKVPALLLQPFIENAINHGLLNKDEPGHLRVEFAITPGPALVCIIEDNGIGRDQAKYINRQRDTAQESFGNAMIRDLVDIFNRYEDIAIEIKVTDKALPLSGTIVEIYIKRQKS